MRVVLRRGVGGRHADRGHYSSARGDSGRDATSSGRTNGTLSVRTKRTGAAAKAGHNLLLHVTAWEATLDDRGRTSPARASSSTSTAPSLRVIEGTGGMQALGDDDKANIEQTIDDEVLKRQDDHVPLDAGRNRPTTVASASRAT